MTISRSRPAAAVSSTAVVPCRVSVRGMRFAAPILCCSPAVAWRNSARPTPRRCNPCLTRRPHRRFTLQLPLPPSR
jgi:hypothetical protein